MAPGHTLLLAFIVGKPPTERYLRGFDYVPHSMDDESPLITYLGVENNSVEAPPVSLMRSRHFLLDCCHKTL